jgi:hypothetical protein
LNEEIKQLNELQAIDLQIAELDEELTLQQGSMADRKAILAERQASMEEMQQKSEALDTRLRDMEGEHADDLARLKDRQSKMMQVQTNREYQSIMKEIEDGKRTNKEREEQVVQIMEQKESYEKMIKEQRLICAEEEKQLTREEEELSSLAAEVNKRKAEIVKTRDAKAKKINASLLKKYNMLRLRRNGTAVVGVTQGVCQGCFMNMPAQMYNEILKGDRMLNCPTCQRILYALPQGSEE